jgi:hypothetical protein
MTSSSSLEQELALLEGLVTSKGTKLEESWNTANRLNKEFQQLDFSSTQVKQCVSRNIPQLIHVLKVVEGRSIFSTENGLSPTLCDMS